MFHPLEAPAAERDSQAPFVARVMRRAEVPSWAPLPEQPAVTALVWSLASTSDSESLPAEGLQSAGFDFPHNQLLASTKFHTAIELRQNVERSCPTDVTASSTATIEKTMHTKRAQPPPSPDIDLWFGKD
jgi:hypothetical protein